MALLMEEASLLTACGYLLKQTLPYPVGQSVLFLQHLFIVQVPYSLFQIYSNPGEGGFVVDITRSTPDAPYGGTFRTKIQICIFPGPEDPLGTSRLRISYEPEFLQTTSLRGVIEKGMAQGMKETYFLYLEVSLRNSSHRLCLLVLSKRCKSLRHASCQNWTA
jgi:hypothetical protein